MPGLYICGEDHMKMLREKERVHYTKSIWVLTLGMAALVIAFLSPLFGILFGIAAIILGKKTMSEAKSKMAYAGFWIGIAAVAVGIALWIISVIYLL